MPTAEAIAMGTAIMSTVKTRLLAVSSAIAPRLIMLKTAREAAAVVYPAIEEALEDFRSSRCCRSGSEPMASAKLNEAELLERARNFTVGAVLAADPAQSQALAEAGGRALADAAGGVGLRDRVLKADFERVAQLHLEAVLQRLEAIMLYAHWA